MQKHETISSMSAPEKKIEFHRLAVVAFPMDNKKCTKNKMLLTQLEQNGHKPKIICQTNKGEICCYG